MAAIGGVTAIYDRQMDLRRWIDDELALVDQWEAVGHELNHLGEMVAVRNRMGLSPF